MKDTYCKENIKVNSYVSFTEKKVIAKAAIEAAHLTKDGRIFKDSAKEYSLNVCALLLAYTNLQIDDKNWAEEYDMLNQEGLISKILALIPKAEREEFSTVWQMVREDFWYNNGSISAVIGKVLDDAIKQMENYLKEQGQI